MSNNSNHVIDQLINKLKHDDFEISSRALKNIDLKLRTNLVSFQNFSQFQIENFITNIFFYIRRNINKIESNKFSQSLRLIQDSLSFTSANFKQNLRKNNLVTFLSEISESTNLDEIIKSTCDSIIKTIINEENMNSFTSKTFSSNNFNNYLSQSAIIPEEIIGHNPKIRKMSQEFSLNSVNLNNSQILHNTIQTFSKQSQNNLNTQDISNKKIFQTIPEIKIFNLTQTFPTVIINKQDEQLFFDTNINLKFGDYLQISKNLYRIYYALIEDFPVEYFLQNSDLMKSILMLVEKADFNEYGIILFKIVHRILSLLERRILFYKEDYMKLSTSACNSNQINYEDPELTLQYPPIENFLLNYNKNNNIGNPITASVLSARDLLVMTAQTLIESLRDVKKFPLYFKLLEKNYEILRKIIFSGNFNNNNNIQNDYTHENMAILYDFLVRLNGVIKFYYIEKNASYNGICRFFASILIEMENDLFVKILGFYMPDIIYLFKEVIFIFENIHDEIMLKLIHKISDVVSYLESTLNESSSKISPFHKTNLKIIHELKKLLDEFEISTTIHKSNEIFYLTKEEYMNKNGNINYQEFLNNFDNILISFKFFLETQKNSDNFSEIIKKFSFIHILSRAYTDDRDKNQIQLITNCFKKFLSFLNILSIQADYQFKLLIYKNILIQLTENNDGNTSDIFPKIISNDLSIFFLFINELSNFTPIKSEKNSDSEDNLETILNEIIYNTLHKYVNSSFTTKNREALLESFSTLVPLNLSNLKFKSLHSLIDYKLLESYSGRIRIFLKYLRLLFSKDEMIRLNCVNHFKIFDTSSILQVKFFKIIEFVNFIINYDQLKSTDLIYFIQSAEKEIPKLIRNILDNSQLEIELFPLLNIFYSNKIEFNLKSSTIEQMCYLVNVAKYKKIFLEVFEFSIEKLNEIFFQIFHKSNVGNDKVVVIENDKLNYLQSLIKLVILIILFYKDEDEVRRFICLIKNNRRDEMDEVEKDLNKSLNLINSIIKLLFTQLLQNKNKHLLCVYSVTLLSYIAFNSDNFEEEIHSAISDKDLDSGEILVKNNNTNLTNLKIFRIPKIFERNFLLNLIPNKSIKMLYCNPVEDGSKNKDDNLMKLLSHTSNKYTMLYVSSKIAKDSDITQIKYHFNMKKIKSELKFNLKDFKQQPNYLQIYLALSNFFSGLIHSQINHSHSSNKQILFENNSEEFLLIFSFFKKILPIKAEEKNLVSDFLSILNTFLKQHNINLIQNQVITKLLNDIIENYIAFITVGTNHKQFVEGLSKIYSENQIFLLEICNCLLENEEIFKQKNFSFIIRNKTLIYKFLELFNNVCLFDECFRPIRISLIRIQIKYFDELNYADKPEALSSLSNLNTQMEVNNNKEIGKELFINFLTNSINTLEFYLGKYKMNINNNYINNINTNEDNIYIAEKADYQTYSDIGYITEILKYFNIILFNATNSSQKKSDFVRELVFKKSFTILKYLNTKFLNLNLLSIRIFKNLLQSINSDKEDKNELAFSTSIESFFNKHSTLLSNIYENLLSAHNHNANRQPFIYLNNLLDFLNFSLETFSKIEEGSEFYHEFLIMNEKLFNEAQLPILLQMIEKNINKNSLFCGLVFKLISNLLNLNPDHYENFFLNTNFYETVNEIFNREKENFKLLPEKNFIKDSEEIVKIKYSDLNFDKKLFYRNKIESLLNINEGLFLITKSFIKVDKKVLCDKENIYHRNRMILNEIFVNSFHLALEINQFKKQIDKETNNQSEDLKFNFRNFYFAIKGDVFKEFAIKYLTYLSFLFEMEISNSNTINKDSADTNTSRNFNLVYENLVQNLTREENLASNSESKQKFFDLFLDLLRFEDSNTNESSHSQSHFEIQIAFAKILPYLLELLELLNSSSSKVNSYNNETLTHQSLKFKSEGEILLELMTSFNFVYQVKIDTYNISGTKISYSQTNLNKINYKFDLRNESDLTNKNVLMNSITSILLTSQNCKKIFIKSNFIKVFIDYVNQIVEVLFEFNLNKNSTYSDQTEKFSSTARNPKNFTFNPNCKENNKNPNQKNFVGFKSQKENLKEIINMHNNHEENLIAELKNVFILFQNLLFKFEDCEEKESLYTIHLNSTKKEKISSSNSTSNVNSTKTLIHSLHEIFYEVIRNPTLFENYLKVLINLISKNDNAKKSFILCFTQDTSDKESFLFLILDYFNKNFLILSSNPNFELFIKFLKCLFQNKFVVVYLQKIKFVENLLKDFENLMVNKKFLQNLKFIEQVLNLLISLSFDAEISKKIATKEFIENLSNFILKVKNENVIYNSLFLFRNLSFIPTNKIHFLVNENLFGSIFAFLSGNYSIRIKFILSHLIWVLLYNNQTLKGILSRDEFKTELKSIQIHLQKENDSKKFLENSKTNKLLEDCCLNFRKILHIIEI